MTMSAHTPESASPTSAASRASAVGPSRLAAGRVLLLFALALVLLLAVAGFAGFQLGRAGHAPAEASADAGFARDMQTHHNQAVQMAMIIRDKTTDPTLRAVAYDIATSQAQQSGQMYGWLAHWGLPATAQNPPMAWMTAGQHQPEAPRQGPSGATTANTSGHSMAGTTGTNGPGGPSGGPPSMASMGMASTEQIRALEQATGVEAERQFLTLMIAHHKGGVDMAQAALRLAERPEVRTLAGAIETAQQAEIAQLQQLLQDRR